MFRKAQAEPVRLLAHKNGQSLVEVVIALAIAILVISSLISVTSTGVKNSQYSKNKELASKLSQEGMEWVRAKRDEVTWSDFASKADGTSWCLYDLSKNWLDLVTEASCDNNVPPLKLNNIFRRNLTLINGGDCGDGVKAVVAVYWEDSAGTHKSESTSCFTNWQNK